MKIIEEIITPDRALEILSKSEMQGFNNRPLSKRTIESYAEDMKSGKWQMNGDVIRISHLEELIDGQHRLHAIIRAGIPQKMLIAYEIEKQTFTTIDRGRTRTLSDLLYIAGYTTYTSRLSPAAKAIYHYVMNENYSRKVRGLKIDIIRKIVEKYEEELIVGVKLYKRFEHRFLITSSTLISLLFFMNRVSMTYADSFFNGLLNGANLSENDPRFL